MFDTVNNFREIAFGSNQCSEVWYKEELLWPIQEIYMSNPNGNTTTRVIEDIIKDPTNNPFNRTRVVVINLYTQPTVRTGNLAGYDVTLVNKGNIQGTYSGSNALVLESDMRLVNLDGYIQGAGGDGGTGGNGGRGGDGGRGADKTVGWIEIVAEWPEFIWGTHEIGDGTYIDVGYHGWKLSGYVNSNLVVTSPCGARINSVPPDYRNWSMCGSWVGTKNKNNWGDSSRDIYFGYSAGSITQISEHVIPGGDGGTGGAGGSPGGSGGAGASYVNPTADSGNPGASGSNGTSGTQNTFTDTNGDIHYGYWGGWGGRGGDAGAGGTGGNWGNNGETGHTGAKGADGIVGTSGSYGTPGTAGTSAGHAITGTNHLYKSEINWGHVYGSTTN